MNTKLISQYSPAIAQALSLDPTSVFSVLDLFYLQDCSVPFLARYRKERTGSLDEVQIRSIIDKYDEVSLYYETQKRYTSALNQLIENKPELKATIKSVIEKLLKASDKKTLDDLYRPYKPKRRSLGARAIEKGLDKLVTELIQLPVDVDIEPVFEKYITPTEDTSVDAANRVNSSAVAKAGATDIVRESISDQAIIRSMVRQKYDQLAFLITSQTPSSKEMIEELTESKNELSKKQKSQLHKVQKFKDYFEYKEKLNRIASHRFMAVRRGEQEKVLKVGFEVDQLPSGGEIVQTLYADVKNTSVLEWLRFVSDEAVSRYLSPSIENEILAEMKVRAELDAIQVFEKNIGNLLMLPPLTASVVMGVDPGYRSGTKCAVVSQTGELKEYVTIHPNFKNEAAEVNKKDGESVLALIKKYKVSCVGVGNGTASREVSKWFSSLRKDHDLKSIKQVIVNEAGASVYSTSDVARQEFPDLDPTIRSAVSIARRLQDPLAELVKVEPRSLGVGQYQHDVNASKLSKKLTDVVESCVNKVGVNLNTASKSLLSYVSGIKASVATQIIQHRRDNGPFESRAELVKIKGFGPKAFEQAAGFLRIPSSKNVLDHSGVHPESYGVVESILKDNQLVLNEIVGRKNLVGEVALEKYVDAKVGMPTLLDILVELEKPGRDPRLDGSKMTISESVEEFTDLKIEMKLAGSVTNVTHFGAFVSLGPHLEGLVHVSDLSKDYITDATKVVGVGDVLEVYVKDLDEQRNRISLSIFSPADREKIQQQRSQSRNQNRNQGSNRDLSRGPSRNSDQRNSARSGSNSRNAAARNGAGSGRKNYRGGSQQHKKPSKPVTIDDLIAKFQS